MTFDAQTENIAVRFATKGDVLMIPRTILFCADFSENSALACETAVDYAKAFNSSLYVLNVLDTSKLGYPIYEGEAPADLQEALLVNVKNTVESSLEKLRQELSARIENISTYSRQGVTSTEILKFANDYSVDLIVLGTHGWTGFKHLIMGSTAENVVRLAKCPVLTVKPNGSPESFL